MLKLTMNPRKRSRRSRHGANDRRSKQPTRYSARVEGGHHSGHHAHAQGQGQGHAQGYGHGNSMMIVDDESDMSSRNAAANAEASSVQEQKRMLADNIAVMLKQEKSGAYSCVDYLSMTAWQHNVYDLLKKQLQHNAQGESRLDEYCREQIVEWSFRVVDYFRIDREIVAVSLNLLDRFLATCRCDRTTFKLAATTTLNLAVKLLHPCKLGELGILSDLSRGEFDMKDVAEMEAHVLRALNWNLHPPTVAAFSMLLLDYAFADRSIRMSPVDVDDLYDIASFFTELAICDYYFLAATPSQIALACVLNALEGMFGHDNTSDHHFVRIAHSIGMDAGGELFAYRHRLWQLYERSEECALHNTYDPIEDDRVAHSTNFVKQTSPAGTSPVGVVTATRNTVSPSNEFANTMHSASVRNGSW